MNNDNRPIKLDIGKTTLHSPIFFPSISTVKTALKPLDYIRILSAIKTTNIQFLVSAYDISHASDSDKDELKNLLTSARQAGAVILMDSGNYESYWKEARETWKQADFHNILREFDSMLAFGYDEQRPPDNLEEHIDLICNGYAKDQNAAVNGSIIPIVHGSSELLPRLCATVANKTNVSTIAVPERRLGDGIFERVSTLIQIRKELNETGKYVGLHLLGTGNPLSVAIYSIYGADSFDGLEWCQTVVDHNSGFLFHLSQADFFKMQTEWGNSGLPSHLWVLAHNLDFYEDWMSRLRASINEKQGVEFCRKNFPRAIYTKCAEAMGW